jgi:hypothetical protein
MNDYFFISKQCLSCLSRKGMNDILKEYEKTHRGKGTFESRGSTAQTMKHTCKTKKRIILILQKNISSNYKNDAHDCVFS